MRFVLSRACYQDLHLPLHAVVAWPRVCGPPPQRFGPCGRYHRCQQSHQSRSRRLLCIVLTSAAATAQESRGWVSHTLTLQCMAPYIHTHRCAEHGQQRLFLQLAVARCLRGMHGCPEGGWLAPQHHVQASRHAPSDQSRTSINKPCPRPLLWVGLAGGGGGGRALLLLGAGALMLWRRDCLRPPAPPCMMAPHNGACRRGTIGGAWPMTRGEG